MTTFKMPPIDMSDINKKWKRDAKQEKKAWDDIRKGLNFLIAYDRWHDGGASIMPNRSPHLTKYEYEGVKRVSFSSYSYCEKNVNLIRKVTQDNANKIYDLKNKIKLLNKRLFKMQQKAFDEGLPIKFEEMKTPKEV